MGMLLQQYWTTPKQDVAQEPVHTVEVDVVEAESVEPTEEVSEEVKPRAKRTYRKKAVIDDGDTTQSDE